MFGPQQRQRQSFCVKNPLKKIYAPIENIFWLIQVPNTSKHIFRNKGATTKASQKTAHAKVFFIWEGHHKKNYSPKSAYWYQCFSV